MAEQTTVQEAPDVVVVERDDGVATVRINRPKALNALNQHVMTELDRAFRALEKDPGVFGIILTGAGEKAFVAGADIAEMVTFGPVEASRMARGGQAILDRIENSSKVVVAAVNGYALGGGCELAMACDFIVASEKARFGQPEVSIGVTPGYAGSQRLARLVGKARAKELVLTGRQIDAEEAFRIGLTQRLVPDAELETAVRELAATIAAQPPLAVEGAKRAVNVAGTVPTRDGLRIEAEGQAVCLRSDDMKEAIAAFVERRAPSYQRR
jgi:enoyl-CoA hydratase